MPTQPSRFLLPTALALSALSFTTGCGAGRMGAAPTEARSPSRDQASATASASEPAAGAPSPAPAPVAPPPPPPGRTKTAPKAKVEKSASETRDLVIYTASLTMAVYQVDQGIGAVEKIATDNGGYLGQKHDRSITIRIPRGRFEQTLGAIDRVGDVTHREIAAQDVTDEHVDLEIRIKNARSMQHRFTELLAKATVKEAIDIEKELHRVTEELELLEGKLKLLSDKIAFSTITVSFEPRSVAIPTQRVQLPFVWLGTLNLPSLLSLSESK